MGLGAWVCFDHLGFFLVGGGGGGVCLSLLLGVMDDM